MSSGSRSIVAHRSPGGAEIHLMDILNPHFKSLTGALAALVVGFQSPALVAGALDGGFLLDAALTTLQMFGAEALDLAGFVIGAELHAGRAGAQDALAGGDGAVMAAAAVLHRAQVYREQGRESKQLRSKGGGKTFL